MYLTTTSILRIVNTTKFQSLVKILIDKSEHILHIALKIASK